MASPFDQLKFKYPWRAYQQRVLDELSGHLADDHLHVVAAPGAGKTTLGIEVMRSLGRPTVIVAPTLTIRDQWIGRLLECFMPEPVSERPSWISTSLHAPEFLTVVTYQALHASFTGAPEDAVESEEESETQTTRASQSQGAALIDRLRDVGVETLVLDEAHHLRKEWWKHLTALKQGLDDLTVVSLTATPPYDVDYREWQRYEALCGPIDAEISVPELVKCGNLCPHQDYIYYSEPTEHERSVLVAYYGGVIAFLTELTEDPEFIALLEGHAWLVDPSEHTEEILKEPEFFSAMLITLQSCGRPLPKAALRILGVALGELPGLSREWFEVLLNGILYQHADQFLESEACLTRWRSGLRQIGAIERRKVKICDTKVIQKVLASSLAKLNSVVSIVEHEAQSLGSDLRLVVLADYIRADQMPKSPPDERAMEKVGVVPVFEFLRKRGFADVKLAVLTGSLVVLPATVVAHLKRALELKGGQPDDVRATALVHDTNYVEVSIRGSDRSLIVNLMTALFKAGHITVLVGTQALLGEGWDAPSLNTLIIASNVGSYMLSNQMRGRAIRIDPSQPNKVANVWHLVGVNSVSAAQQFSELAQAGRYIVNGQLDPFDLVRRDLGYDFERMRRRFRAFEGVSYHAPFVIENGFARLGLASAEWTTAGITATNRDTLERAGQRQRLAGAWEAALQGASPKPEMHERIEAKEVPGVFAFNNTLKFLVINALLGGLSTMAYVMQASNSGTSSRDSWLVVLIALLAGLCYTVPRLLRALFLWFRNGTLEKQIKQVGLAVVDSLRHLDLITTAPQSLRVVSGEGAMGYVYAKLEGGTIEEQRYFLAAMEALLNPVDNPRYLLIRKNHTMGISTVDYHAVPDVIGAKKAAVEYFARQWKRYVGACQAVYTRTGDGRAALLKARAKSLSASFLKKAERKSVWE
ncbi:MULTISPECIES: DEAD/DEAH box helicase family protein [unclassified Lentimonas]|uniref:DEAD/DEAH box helicase family protein n=1 Tax=unclassified Lentimonas TaxID=2630993 RepID=UPI0013240707|nr:MULTISPECIES: DEAD/DEAH box helicase family protein [unclassified Lentimonas]CAA6690361.1 Unannotated [Lentimonas sp. CC10]CAA6693067.1 Unannotated [Lentimonas sp. CC19]CAA7069026.1 Unannotated [Lentimonas sp. CC11]